MSAARQTHRWRGRLLADEPLARYTSWGVGGPAERLFNPDDRRELLDYLAQMPAEEPLCWLGLGSNVLVRDGGIRGSVILTRGSAAPPRVLEDGDVWVEAGMACAKLARFLARQERTGGEFLAGIPGTLGGALAMNAGAYGGEIWSFVRSVETVDRHGVVQVRDRDEYQIGYRSVVGPVGEWFLSSRMQFPVGDGTAARTRISTLLERRAATQPLRQRSCGSVFRNPPGDHAARLIEHCGLKGRRIGGAEVSRKHANFIVNTGSATATDIETLLRLVRDTVFEQTGTLLQTEVRILGEPQ